MPQVNTTLPEVTTTVRQFYNSTILKHFVAGFVPINFPTIQKVFPSIKAKKQRDLTISGRKHNFAGSNHNAVHYPKSGMSQDIGL